MNLTEIREMQEQRGALAAKAGEILTTSKKENRDFTAEEEEKFDKLHAECDALKVRIDRADRQSRVESELGERAASRETMAALTPGDGEDRQAGDEKRYNEAFSTYLRRGLQGLDPEQQTMMNDRFQRAQGTTPDTAGGYTIAQGFMDMLEVQLKAFGGMREAARVLPTARGEDLPWPTSDDTWNEGELTAENTEATEQDVLYGEIVLGAFQYDSKLVKVPMQLLTDTSIPFESELFASALANRIGRITNRHFTSGTGTGQPEGVLTAAGNSGFTATTAGAIAWPDIVNLEHSIDPAYRTGARWMMSDAVLKAVKLIVDDNGRPLWQPAASSGIGTSVRQDTIDGYPVTINQDMAGVDPGDISLLYGDFSKYIIRDVTDTQIMWLTERFATARQVGFIQWSRHDGRALFANDSTNNPDGEPIKYLAQAP